MKKTKEQKVDAIIIGGGVAGLTTAAFLARQGKRVQVLEKASAIGGRARTKEQDGFLFNIGAHALYRGGHGIEILQELGVTVQGKVPEVSGGFAIHGGKKHTLPFGSVSLLTTDLFGLSAKMEVGRLLGSLTKINGQPLMKMSVREWINKTLKDPVARELVLATFRLSTYVNAPDLMSAGTAVEQLKLALTKSVLYLDGGWQTLVDGLRKVATETGATITTNARVETVERDAKGAVRGVRMADGRQFAADVVVIASSPKEAAAMVENSEGTSLARYAADAIPVKAAVLDVALSNLPVKKATFALGVDAPLYLSVHSLAAKLAPDGSALVSLLKYLPPEQKQSGDEDERELEALLDLVQPGWRDVLLHKRFLPSMITVNAIPLASQGGTTGRPAPQVDDIGGLFVVGDWVGSDGLLVDGSLASARQAAMIITAQNQTSIAAYAAD